VYFTSIIAGDYENSWKNYYLNVTIANKHFEEFDVEFVALISRTIDAFLSHVERENVRKVDKYVSKYSCTRMFIMGESSNTF